MGSVATKGPQKLRLERRKILDFSHFLASFPSSVIITFYDLIFVFSTLPGKREYFKIHVHKKFTKLTPEKLKAIALMYLVTLKKNFILSWTQLYC